MARVLLIMTLFVGPIGWSAAAGAVSADRVGCDMGCCEAGECGCEMAPAEPAPTLPPVVPPRAERDTVGPMALSFVSVPIRFGRPGDDFVFPGSDDCLLSLARDAQALLCVWRT